MNKSSSSPSQAFIWCQAGSVVYSVLAILVTLTAVVSLYKYVANHSYTNQPHVLSGISGNCLDTSHNLRTAGNPIDARRCNNTAAQVFTANISTISLDGSNCLTVTGNAQKRLTPVELTACNGSDGQVWLRDQAGYINPNSGYCLAVPAGNNHGQLVIDSCNDLATARENWTPAIGSKTVKPPSSCSGSEGAKIACSAIAEWTRWQAPGSNHEQLLSAYTDGTPYEEWCADFVSYVYRQAGYPFSQGSANGWDQNNANDIQYMGFTIHQADSSYVPQTGDVAFFDYSAGHVEIVVSGGKTPTFIYGDSATIDPTTGNGQMMANTILSEGNQGQVQYYMTPQAN